MESMIEHRHGGHTWRAPAYAFDNARELQEQRLRALEELLDPGTIHLLDACGVGPGWRCAEIGAGGGSIAAWLAARVGESGQVLATDLDVRHVQAYAAPNLEVLQHDVLTDDLPAETFDLVHLRLLLAWLPDPANALQRLVRSLKPGGVLIAEEMDFLSVAPDPRLDERWHDLFGRAVAAHHAVLAQLSGFDAAYGRRLAGELAAAGLVSCGCEGRAGMWRGGEAGGRVWGLTFAQLQGPLLASRRLAAEELERVLRLCADPTFSFLSQVTVAAWGHRPAR